MYSRFRALNKYDLDQIQNSTVAVVGLGSTGSVIAENLARHGVNLVLIDRDWVEENDLYSSNLFQKNDAENALPKAKAAKEKLSDFTSVEAYVENLDSDTINLLDSVDMIMDGTDNLETRYLIHDYSQDNGIPWIYTSALGEKGFSMLIEDKCFKCLFDRVNPKKSCENNGILREVSSMAASVSCKKALEYLSRMEVNERVQIIPQMDSFEPPKCTCNKRRELEISHVCGEDKYQVFGEAEPESFSGKIEVSNDYLKRIDFEGNMITIFSSGRAIIEAPSLEDARRVYEAASSI